jgi:ABC-type lipoprotein release transport system permease subunit
MNSPDLDNQIIYMSLKTAQLFSSAEGNITSLSVNLDNPDDVDRTVKEIKNQVDLSQYEVMSWKEMLVEFVQYINSKNASQSIIRGILYMVIGFGIFGTILMMTAERIREFGVMISVGMQKARLMFVVIFESVLIGMVGVISGAVASLPIILYFSHHPVPMGGGMGTAMASYGFEPLFCFAPPQAYFITNALLVLVIVLIASIYPVRKIRKLNVINALHNKI